MDIFYRLKGTLMHIIKFCFVLNSRLLLQTDKTSFQLVHVHKPEKARDILK